MTNPLDITPGDFILAERLRLSTEQAVKAANVSIRQADWISRTGAIEVEGANSGSGTARYWSVRNLAQLFTHHSLAEMFGRYDREGLAKMAFLELASCEFGAPPLVIATEGVTVSIDTTWQLRRAVEVMLRLGQEGE